MITPIVLLLFARTNPHTFWIGLPLVVVGEAIRLWSAGYLNKLQEVTTAGPFALCRNPLYVGSFFGSMGYFIMSNQLVALIIGPILFWMFHAGAVAREEYLLKEKFGDEYVKYCKSVPRYFPRSLNLKGNGQFSLKQLLKNNEYNGLAASIAVSVLFALVAYYRPELEPIKYIIH